eukprot:TRINITY_DN6873_c0_g1_i1.p1 TRINITY_DN6873_c0_g1~~TRINITY_DN6873_c0_g1_i1.p1  ORF type:complete len:217 (+),score=17.60 TRINITY_DN6873_c0_g1_i1:569-1219(+)
MKSLPINRIKTFTPYIMIVMTLILLSSIVVVSTVIGDQILSHSDGDTIFSMHCESFQGKEKMVDDRGNICNLDVFDYKRGCCPQMEKGIEEKKKQYSCYTCTDSCCKSYEYCISCCMSPQNFLTFSMCKDVCRTSSRSVDKGNKWISDYKHCFDTEPREDRVTVSEEEEQTHEDLKSHYGSNFIQFFDSKMVFPKNNSWKAVRPYFYTIIGLIYIM